MAHNAENTFSQLLRFLLCMILLMTSIPFIGLAAIFSIFTDIPHLKIELGADNAVESVYFNLKKTEKKEEEEEEEEDNDDDDSGYETDKEDNKSETDGEEEEEEEDDENPELYSVSKEFAVFFVGIKITEMITTYKSIQKMVTNDIKKNSGMVGKFINYDEELWELLDLDDDEEEYSLEDIYEKLKEKKLIIPIKKIELCATPVCNTPMKCPDAPRRLRGRVGSFSDDSPITPSKLDMAQLETLLNDKLTLDSGVVLENITPIPCESFEQEDGAQTPSECPPSS
jgi:hypothetical protein